MKDCLITALPHLSRLWDQPPLPRAYSPHVHGPRWHRETEGKNTTLLIHMAQLLQSGQAGSLVGSGCLDVSGKNVCYSTYNTMMSSCFSQAGTGSGFFTVFSSILPHSQQGEWMTFAHHQASGSQEYLSSM